MPDSMITRIARHIEPFAWASIGTFDERAYGNLRDQSLVKARSVLAAMRDPLDEMVDSGELTSKVECECMYARDVWEAMIDAALAEER